MRRLLLVLTFVLSLSGCAALLVGGAATSISAIHDRRTVGTMIDDQTIEFKILQQLSEKEFFDHSHISATSYNKSVLLVGQVPNENVKQKVERLVQNTVKVEKVFNELEIQPAISLGRITKDSVITSEVKTRMLLRKGLDPTRIKVVTEDGVVYLMGLVNTDEALLATDVVKDVSGVKKITRLFEYGDYVEKAAA